MHLEPQHTAISIKGLTKSFKNLHVLNNVNLEVKKGSVVALLGPNGAGKTTTVRMLSTLLKPDSGDAVVNGYSVVREPGKVRASIGLTGQYAAVDEYLSGRENLEMMGRLYHLSASDTTRRTNELLEQFDLTEAAGRVVKTYSGGMRRRLDLAASLIATPPVVFLDEPTTGLDPRSRLAMWAIIEKLVEADVTILLTTQYLEEADTLADRIAVLDHGRIIIEGTPDELKRKVGNERIKFVVSAEGVDKVAQALESREPQVDSKRGEVSVATEGALHEVRDVLDVVVKTGVPVESMSIHKPTLDDVFLQFTGHAAEANAANSEEMSNAHKS